MAQPYIGEIKMFGGNFAIQGYAFCNGQLVAISQNDALFSLIGTTYGGDGQNTFGLPDLRGRIPVHQGTGPGLSTRTLGQTGGSETVTLTTPQIASHNHSFVATSSNGTTGSPQGNIVAAPSIGIPYNTSPPENQLGNQSINNTGGSQSHNNVMPFQCVTYIIALYGIYPSPN